MTRKTPNTPSYDADWRMRLVSHLAGKSSEAIAREDGLTAEYTRRKLRQMQRDLRQDLPALVADALQQGVLKAATQISLGDNARDALRTVAELGRAARLLGFDPQQLKRLERPGKGAQADEGSGDEISDPHAELRRRYRRLHAARKAAGDRGPTEPR